MEDEGGEEPPAPGTEEDALLKPLLRPAVSRSQVSKAGPRLLSPTSKPWPHRAVYLLPEFSAQCFPLQGAAEPSPALLLSAKPQKRKAAEMNPELMQRTATIGSCPVIYSQPLMAASKYQPSPVPLTSLRPRQRLQGEMQSRANLRLPPGHAVPQPSSMAMQPGYLGVTAPAAPSVMSYSECAMPAGLAAVPPAPARGSLPATSTAEHPPPPPPPQTPPPPTPKAPPPPDKPEKPRKGRKEKVGGCSRAVPLPACLLSWCCASLQPA